MNFIKHRGGNNHSIQLKILIGVCWTICLSANLLNAQDWPQFRGPNSSGIYSGLPIPVQFGPGVNEKWRTKLPPGHSSPVVVGERIFLTGFRKEQSQLDVLCLNRSTGKILWTRSLDISKFETGHPSFNPASSTVAADAQHVVAYFGSYGLICFSHDGKMVWEKRMPLPKSYAGNATSPAIMDDKVILYRGNHVDHFVIAIDKKTGKTIWRIEQDEPFASELACTACPIRNGNQLILHSARGVQSLNIQNGKTIWRTRCATTATSTPVISKEEVIVAAWNKMGEPALRPDFPEFAALVKANDRNDDRKIQRNEFPRMMIFHRPEGAEAPQNGASLRFENVDANRDGSILETEWNNQLKKLESFRSQYQSHGILAIGLDQQGNIDHDQIRILETQGIPEVPSPLLYRGVIYLVKNGGAMTGLSLQTGKRLFRMRTGGKGTHYASPIVANNFLITTAGNGKMTVLDLNMKTGQSKPKIVATNEMGEHVYATPAVAEGVLYVRTHQHLFAFHSTGTNE